MSYFWLFVAHSSWLHVIMCATRGVLQYFNEIRIWN
jgi:hypothetical protein